MKPQVGCDFEWVDVDGRPALVCRPLAAHAHHLFTTRLWALGSAADGDNPAAWSAVAAAMHVAPGNLVRARQVHGASVLARRRGMDDARNDRTEADIIVSDDPNVAVAIQTADCVALLIADGGTGAIGAAHAGWRGLAANVPGAALAAMNREFGTRPGDVIAAAGPSISAPRYEVGEDVRTRFAAAFGAGEIARWFPMQTRASHWAFDGWAAARDQLIAAGVPSASIHMSNLCTAGRADLFCSYRRDGKGAGRMAGAIRARRG